MLLISISALVLSVVVENSHGYYYGNRVDTGRLPLCPTPNKPCRLRASLRTSDGEQIETIGTGTCTCPPPNTCPEDWNDSRHVISRRVVTTSHNMTLQMMFCDRVQPKTFCRPENISLVVKGSMIMPQDIDSYNCQCRMRQPLILKERSIGLDHNIYQSYACANHVEICSRSDPCMIMHRSSTDYPCKCRNGLFCRIPDHLWGDEITNGYCRP